MPEKTHPASCRVAASARRLASKLRWRRVADRGVKTSVVIDFFEEYPDREACLVEIPVFVAMNLLVF
jgi:hypothetical protein